MSTDSLPSLVWNVRLRKASHRLYLRRQLYLEDVYEATGYRLAADSPAALQAGGARRRGGAGGAVSQRDQGAVQVQRTDLVKNLIKVAPEL